MNECNNFYQWHFQTLQHRFSEIQYDKFSNNICHLMSPIWYPYGLNPMDYNGGYVDVLFTCGECGFSSFKSCFCYED